MNDTKRAKIYARHFAVIVDLYKQWKLAQGGPEPQVVIMNPST